MKRKTIAFLSIAIFLVVSVPGFAFAEKQVIIDPGHGGEFTGTTGFSGESTGYYEKIANLEVSLRLRDILQKQGFTVNMTRETDREFTSSSAKDDLRARMKKANSLAEGNRNNAIFISVHHNALPSDPSMRGYETYYFDINEGINETYPPDPLQIHYSPASRRLANIIHTNVLDTVPISEGRGIIANDLFVTRNAQMPSVLVELGYMSNPDEEKLIKTASYQQKAAEGLASGINDYFNVFEVYNYKDERLETFETESKAMDYAQSKENIYVFDKAEQETLYNNITTNYEVHHSSQGLIYEPFVTKEDAVHFAQQWLNTKVINTDIGQVVWTYHDEPYLVEQAITGEKFEAYTSETAIDYAKKRENTSVILKETGEVIWSNYEDKPYVVEHSHQGPLYYADIQKDAITYAKKWKNTAVVVRETGEVIWSNYLDKPYVVEHSYQGELFDANNQADAIAYAKKWKNTAVVVRETGEVIWSNYLDKPYVVEHSYQGELFDANNQADAIAYAKKWKNTAVVVRETGEVIWSNYLDKPYVVEHSSQGELFDAYNKEDAITFAEKWKHTAVIVRDTEEVVWSNYLEVK